MEWKDFPKHVKLSPVSALSSLLKGMQKVDEKVKLIKLKLFYYLIVKLIIKTI